MLDWILIYPYLLVLDRDMTIGKLIDDIEILYNIKCNEIPASPFRKEIVDTINDEICVKLSKLIVKGINK